MSEWIDVTRTLRAGMVHWPTDRGFQLNVVQCWSGPGTFNLSFGLDDVLPGRYELVALPLKMTFDSNGIQLECTPGSLKMAPASIELKLGAASVKLSPATVSLNDGALEVM